MSYKIDLHTHSISSPDGALREADYKRALSTGLLDYIAVTDHNTIEFAKQLHAELGEQIIVGEEIATAQGEIIGLYLTETIPAHLSARETIGLIKAQKGLVCIPHPFEIVRKGLSMATLDGLVNDVDIIEVHNGRALLRSTSEAAKEWAVRNEVAGAASSDAHGWQGWGRTYAVIPGRPTKEHVVHLLHEATYEARWPGVMGMLYPKVNRLKKKLGHA